jgi:hypothetical protein
MFDFYIHNRFPNECCFDSFLEIFHSLCDGCLNVLLVGVVSVNVVKADRGEVSKTSTQSTSLISVDWSSTTISRALKG